MNPLTKMKNVWLNRSFPRSVEAFRCVKVSYSMHGEDLIAASLLMKYQGEKTFVDIGCFDPIRWSNTYHFYLRGWRGVCVDPNAALEARWRRLRPEDQFVVNAVGEYTGEVLYREVEGSEASNFVVKTTQQGNGEIGAVVTPRRLDAILADSIPDVTRFGLMNVDCEGMDLEVLRSNDWNRWRPEVLIVEDNDLRWEGPLVKFCEAQGYELRGLVGKSFVFLQRTELKN